MADKAANSFTEEKIILSMLSGMWKSRCLNVIVSLGIPELLCESSGSVSIQNVAEKTGCRTDEQLYIIMRAMDQWGIGEEIVGEKRFKANRHMQLLRRDKGPSLGHMVGYHTSDEMWTAMLDFPEAVKTGNTAFELAHGMNLFDYMFKVQSSEYCTGKLKSVNVMGGMGSSQRRRELAENYNHAMPILSQLDLLSAQPNVLSVYRWDKSKRIMDIGGGKGEFLASILKMPGCEHIHGLLFEFPDVLEHAKQFLAVEGIPAHRVTFIAGDILTDTLQIKEVDTIIIKNLFFMLEEEGMIKVLERCSGVLAKGGKFVIVNSCNPEAGDTEHNVTKTGLQPAFSRGILIMTCHKQGGFKTKSESLSLIDRLCTRVAFRLNQVFETGDGPTLFELYKCDKNV